MSPNGSAQRGSDAAKGRSQSRAPFSEGVAKATVKYREEQANKPPSARTSKAKERKARAKERNDVRKETDEYQARKATWNAVNGQRIEFVSSLDAKRAKANKRKDRKFEEIRGMKSDFD